MKTCKIFNFEFGSKNNYLRWPPLSTFPEDCVTCPLPDWWLRVYELGWPVICNTSGTSNMNLARLILMIINTKLTLGLVKGKPTQPPLNWEINALFSFHLQQNLRLEYDEDTKTVKNAPGVETRVPGFGDTNTIEHLDTDNLIKYFAPVVDRLVSWGYERGVTVRAAPYDFRYGPGK